jgi:hypothetical protein
VGIDIETGDFEDPWHRGFHDGKTVASIIVNLALSAPMRPRLAFAGSQLAS